MKTINIALWIAVVAAMTFSRESTFASDLTGPRANIGTNHTLTGSYSSILGGKNNTVTNFQSVIAGGTNNFIGGYEAVISGGRDNYIEKAKHTVIAGGHNNAIFTSGGEHAVIGGGEQNTNNSMWATIGGGWINLITTNSDFAVIAGGHSNTMKQMWGFIGGGYFNHVSPELTDGGSGMSAGGGGFVGGGAYNSNYNTFSAIVGGVLNTIRGDWSFIGGGYQNQNNGYISVIGGGEGNIIRTNIPVGWGYSAIVGGLVNEVKTSLALIGGGLLNTIDVGGAYGVIGGGAGNLVNAELGTVPGGSSATASHYGQLAYASGAFVNPGDAQTSTYVVRRATTDATQSELFLDGSSARMTIPSGTTWTFCAQITARSSGGNSAGYKIEAVIDNNSGATSFVVAPTTTVLGEDIGAWDVLAQADDTNDALVLKVTGAASTNIRWVATVRTTEVAY